METNSYLYITVETSLIFIIVVKTLIAGANVNAYFKKHKKILLNLKEDVVMMKTLTKERGKIQHKLFDTEIKEIFIKDANMKETLRSNLDEIEDMIDVIIEKLDF